ncbi:MAG TPA: alkaline phosphatase D family protein [Phycisphaerae bacterium]|nr:alkaline phosphatase D family protein [Phycisphaerae bacterium]
MLAVVAVAGVGQQRAWGQGFSLGVAAGDVTDRSAVLWTRSDEPANLILEVATDEGFGNVAVSMPVTAGAETDYTVKVEVGDLAASTLFFYRFINADHPERRSRVGRFSTTPPTESAARFRFVFSGDSNAAYSPWRLMEYARSEQADFFLWFGDVTYADLSHPGSPPAEDLAGYRAKYRETHADGPMQDLLGEVPIWCGWDDHEVFDDYDGGEPQPPVTRERIEQAYQAFFEYMPIRVQNAGGDEFRTYRRFRYGQLAEFFLIDGRQYRQSHRPPECDGTFDPYGLVVEARDQDCVDRLEAEDRTMLGAEQFQWLLNGLAESTARYKFIVNNVPLTSYVVRSTDHWDGYDAERRALLEFIDAAGITGVHSLVTEVHANVYNPDVASFFRQHRPGYRLSDGFALPELAVGPIAAGTFRFETSLVIDQYLPVQNCLESTIRNWAFDAAISRIAELNEWAFYELDRWAYLLVDVGPEGVTFSYRGIEPGTAQPALRTLYTVGPAGPPCVGIGLLIVFVPAVWLVRVAHARRIGNRRAPRPSLPDASR